LKVGLHQVDVNHRIGKGAMFPGYRLKTSKDYPAPSNLDKRYFLRAAK